jgi:small subunit ribosomal protein S7
MWDGKKSTALKYFMMQLTLYKSKKQQDASLEIWKDALTNVMPHVEVRSRRVGGYISNSMQIRPDRKNFYGNEVVNTLFKKK